MRKKSEKKLFKIWKNLTKCDFLPKGLMPNVPQSLRQTLLVVNLDEAPADPVASAAITEGTTGRLSATPFGLSAYKGNFTIQVRGPNAP